MLEMKNKMRLTLIAYLIRNASIFFTASEFAPILNSLSLSKSMATNKFATMLPRINTDKAVKHLVYAILEWVLIILLLFNSLFTYLIKSFANYFALKPPCILCSRIDHLFNPQTNSSNPISDLVCEAHFSEISALSSCPTHKKLTKCHSLCEECWPSSQSCSPPIWTDPYCTQKADLVIEEVKEEGGGICKVSSESCSSDLFDHQEIEFEHDFESLVSSKEVDGDNYEKVDGDDSVEIMNLPCPDSTDSDLVLNHLSIVELIDSSTIANKEEFEDQKRVEEESYGLKSLEITLDDEETNLQGPKQREEKLVELESNDYLQKKLLLLQKRSEMVATPDDSLDGSMVSETDCCDLSATIEQLKEALRSERKALTSLYAELEEERSASAIATNQTMAMITRLQEEKAKMQMEALQYQRMMEEQSEYDQEALQLLNELVVKREKEKEELEKELKMYRRKDMIANLSSDEEKEETNNNDKDNSYDEGLDVDLDGIAIDCVNHISALDESLEEFEEERLLILDELKALEEKLVMTIGDDDTEGLLADEESGFLESKKDGDGIEEEVDRVYGRLQALETDGEFLKNCMSSVKKGDKGMDLLQEILQHLRDIKDVELRVKNISTTSDHDHADVITT